MKKIHGVVDDPSQKLRCFVQMDKYVQLEIFHSSLLMMMLKIQTINGKIKKKKPYRIFFSLYSGSLRPEETVHQLLKMESWVVIYFCLEIHVVKEHSKGRQGAWLHSVELTPALLHGIPCCRHTRSLRFQVSQFSLINSLDRKQDSSAVVFHRE